MALLDRLRPGRAWHTGTFPAPWAAGRPAIYTFVEARRRAPERNDTGLDWSLPDDDIVFDDKALKLAPGFADSLVTEAAEPGQAQAIFKLIKAVLRRPGPRNIKRFYDRCLDGRTIEVVDTLGDLVRNDLSMSPARLALFFGWLARRAPDREPVKIAIAMLGVLGGDREHQLFLTLATHSEFTPYAAVALQAILEPKMARATLFDLAQEVRGWGRIDLVHRLAAEPDAAVRRWLVREGFRNDVLDELLAYTAATSGDLLGQLDAPGADADDALLDGAAGILAALVRGGAAKDMHDYGDGAAAARRWLDLVAGRASNLHDAEAAVRLLDHADVARRTPEQSRWDENEAAMIEQRAHALLADAKVVDLVEAGLRADDLATFEQARAVAPVVGVDPWQATFDRQVRRGGSHWFDLLQSDDVERIDRVIELALATGDGSDPQRRGLNIVVWELERFPGKGAPLVTAALESPYYGARHTAVSTLGRWGRGHWPPGTEARLQTLREAEDETDSALRDAIDGLLRRP